MHSTEYRIEETCTETGVVTIMRRDHTRESGERAIRGLNQMHTDSLQNLRNAGLPILFPQRHFTYRLIED